MKSPSYHKDDQKHLDRELVHISSYPANQLSQMPLSSDNLQLRVISSIRKYQYQILIQYNIFIISIYISCTQAMGSSSSSSSSASSIGDYAVCEDIDNYLKLNGQKIIKAAVVITPLQSRKVVGNILLSLRIIQMVGSAAIATSIITAGTVIVPFMIAKKVLNTLTVVGLGAITSQLMFHLKIWIELDGLIELIIQFGNKGLFIKKDLCFLNNYKLKESADIHPCSQANYIHKQKGQDDVLKMVDLKEDVFWKQIMAVIKQNQSKRYNVVSFNCKDYVQDILKVIQKQ